MAHATQPISTTPPALNYSHMQLGEAKADTYTTAIAPLVIANSVPPPVQITKLENQLLILKFQSREDRSKFVDVHRATTFKTTAYFTTFIDDTAPPSQPANLSLLTKGNATIEAILKQLNEIWGQETVARLTITNTLSI
jgi:hypothetical protein